MMPYLWIALGSALGGAARYWCQGWAARLIGETFPWGTLIVNIVGCTFIGLFATITGPAETWIPSAALPPTRTKSGLTSATVPYVLPLKPRSPSAKASR